MESKTRLSRAPRALLVSVAVLLPLLGGCQKKSGPERVEELRAKYDVRLNGFVVREAPVAAPTPEATPAVDGTPAPAASPAPSPEAVAPPIVAEVPSKRDVVLDLLVHSDARESLPGITVDVSQAGADETEKAHFRIWLDTARISRGQSTQVSHVLEDIDFSVGDRFAVEVVSPVPAEQRGEYREFQAP